MLDHFNNLYARLLILAFCIKFISMGSITNSEAAVVIFLVLYEGLSKWLFDSKRNNEIKEVINKQNEVILKLSTEVDALKTNITGIRLGQGFKKVS